MREFPLPSATQAGLRLDAAAGLSRRRQGVLLWLAGMPGIVAVSWLVVPALVAGRPLPMPMVVVSLASAVQSALLLALAVWIGSRTAAAVGLRAPAFSALAARVPLAPALGPQWVPGLAGAAAGTALLLSLGALTPAALTEATGSGGPPLLVKVLYGGVTEEILMRWGLLSMLVWLPWRVFRRRTGPPSTPVFVSAILLSALAFGAGHLPAAAALVQPLTPGIVAYVVIGNATFGIVAGTLYWRFGLEAAIIAHAGTHLATTLIAAVA